MPDILLVAVFAASSPDLGHLGWVAVGEVAGVGAGCVGCHGRVVCMVCLVCGERWLWDSELGLEQVKLPFLV